MCSGNKDKRERGLRLPAPLRVARGAERSPSLSYLRDRYVDLRQRQEVYDRLFIGDILTVLVEEVLAGLGYEFGAEMIHPSSVEGCEASK